jgi:hypothetical protein
MFKKSKKQLIAILLMTAPCISMANESLYTSTQLEFIESYTEQNDISGTTLLDLFNPYFDEEVADMEQSTKSKPLPKGRSEMEKILGTWSLSFRLGKDTYTDQLMIDELFTTNKGEVEARGESLVVGGTEKGDLRCLELPPSLAKPLESDYTCVANSAPFVHLYSFRISGDTVTSGFYGLGKTLENASNSLASKTIPLTKGIRGNSTVKPISKNSSRLSNLSTRANISGGQDDAFAGFVVSGNIPIKVIIRGISVEDGVDPAILLLNSSTKAQLAQNDNWESHANANAIRQLPSHLQLPNANDAGLLMNLDPGVYDVVLSSTGSSGLAIISVDEVN